MSDEEEAAEARARRAMAWALAWGVVTLALLWWFDAAYRI